MEPEVIKKAQHLIHSSRVMTLAVSKTGTPWSSPVYFVFADDQFYFFSNENSRHIKDANNHAPVAASVFHDSDDIGQIFGFQMSGVISPVKEKKEYLLVVKKYSAKFTFLEKIFGPQLLENKNFFLEKFKSQLYSFQPDEIFLSDNSRPSGKRETFELSVLRTGCGST